MNSVGLLILGAICIAVGGTYGWFADDLMRGAARMLDGWRP
jgi:hypothetical protein